MNNAKKWKLEDYKPKVYCVNFSNIRGILDETIRLKELPC